MSPNPASEFVTITLQQPSEIDLSLKNSNTVYDIRILDIFGKLKYSTKRSGDSFSVPLNSLNDGNYFLQIIDKGKISNLRLVVKN